MKLSTAVGKEIQSVQIIRAIAAIAVVLFHTNVILSLPEYGGLDVWGWASRKGWLGVNLFFVLSGFIIFTAHKSDFGQPNAIARYLWRRVTRLYPIYWFLLTGFITAASLGIGHAEINWDPRHIITAYSLLSVADAPVLPLKVAWTLLFEVKFYLIFMIFLLSYRLGVFVMVVWGFAILYRSTLDAPYDWGNLAPDWGLLSLWNTNFLFGLVAAASVGRVPRGYGIYLFLAGMAILVITASSIHGMETVVTDTAAMLLLGLAFSAILVGCVTLERDFGFQPPSWAKLLGDASYSIYLVHSAVISQAANVGRKLMAYGLPIEIVFIVAFLGATLAGVLVHLVIEKPLLRLIRHLSLRKSVMAIP